MSSESIARDSSTQDLNLRDPAAQALNAHESSAPDLSAKRSCASLECLFIGDALAMPVHWFYRPSDILRFFPPSGIIRMEAATDRHPSSIMSLHSTRKGGRGSQGRAPRAGWLGRRGRHDTSGKISGSDKSGTAKAGSDADTGEPREIVGEVILRGKRHLWGQPEGHYHHALPAGENTLNTWCARELMQLLTESGNYDADAWLSAYIDLLCADPPRHPDTYAESYHRGFFANLEAGKSPRDCAAVTHDTPSMGALVTIAPLALALFPSHELNSVQAICRRHVALTHPNDVLARVVDAYVELMHSLLYAKYGGEGNAPFIHAARAIQGTRLDQLLDRDRDNADVVGGIYGLACYITDSWPSVCYLAARYRHDPAAGLLCNANLGGENAHRGAVLGTLLGLAAGSSPDELFDQLARRVEISDDIGRWQARFFG